MDPKKVIKQYARATFKQSSNLGSVSTSFTAESNTDSSPEQTASVIAQSGSAQLAMIAINKLKKNNLLLHHMDFGRPL